jgi:lipid-binding SYLF domain-containing protein
MRFLTRFLASVVLVSASAWAYAADDYGSTMALFKKSSEAGSYFGNSYGYALFPTVGEGGFVVAGAHGTGRVYVHGVRVGTTSVNMLSIGSQIGGKAFSQIIFFENKKAFDDFTSGNFEFGAGASAVAITAGAQASIGTSGANASIGENKHDAGAKGAYWDGMATFTIIKGGAMVSAAVGGEKFSYTPKR